MPAPAFQRLRAAYLRRRHTVLLVAIVVALMIRPLVGSSGSGPLVFSVAMLVLLLTALLAIRVDGLIGDRHRLLAQKRRHSVVIWALASVAIGERLYMVAAPTPRVLLLGTIAWFLLIAVVTWGLLRHLLRHREITGETISLSISIYLLLGLAWGLLYTLILEMQPQAFRFEDTALAITAQTEAHTLPILVYFSLTTLSTVGFGDITPATLFARYLAVAEGITGQLYLAILVARLVGIHLSQHASPGT